MPTPRSLYDDKGYYLQEDIPNREIKSLNISEDFDSLYKQIIKSNNRPSVIEIREDINGQVYLYWNFIKTERYEGPKTRVLSRASRFAPQYQDINKETSNTYIEIEHRVYLKYQGQFIYKDNKNNFSITPTKPRFHNPALAKRSFLNWF